MHFTNSFVRHVSVNEGPPLLLNVRMELKKPTWHVETWLLVVEHIEVL
jgi:hypothetical protein